MADWLNVTSLALQVVVICYGLISFFIIKDINKTGWFVFLAGNSLIFVRRVFVNVQAVFGWDTVLIQNFLTNLVSIAFIYYIYRRNVGK